MSDVSGPRVISERGRVAVNISLNSLTFLKSMAVTDRSSRTQGISMVVKVFRSTVLDVQYSILIKGNYDDAVGGLVGIRLL